MKRILGILFVTLLFASCADDDDDGLQSIPPPLLSETEPVNRAAIIAFLKTHFYNAEEFQNPPAGFDFKIDIDTIAGENSDRTPLIQQVDSAIINVNSVDFGLTDGEVNVPHQYYYLTARRGAEAEQGGLSPTFADSTLVRFDGMLLDFEEFDASSDFVWFDLSNAFRGFSNGLTNFNSGTQDGLMVNPDGTVGFSDSAIGLIVMPAGLASYFSQGSIPSFTSIAFQVEVGSVVPNTDTDNDGIPSIMEDVDGNGNTIDDDTDQDGIPNFVDGDDDGDGILTSEEIVIDANGVVSFPDSDGDLDSGLFG